jgi:large repetitive protein
MKKFIIQLTSITIVLSLGVISFAQAAPEIIKNNATVSSPTTDKNLTNNTAETSDKLCFKADISTTLTDSLSTVTPLSNNTYTGTISNAGPSNVSEITFDFTYKNTDYSAIGSVTVNNGSISLLSSTPSGDTTVNKYKVTGLNLASGQNIVATIPATATANPASSVSTALTALPIGPANNDPDCSIKDPNLTNNPSTDITTGTLEADLSIIKTSSSGSSSVTGAIGTMDSKTEQTYTLTATNNGPSNAIAPITVVDTLPLQVEPTNVSGSTCTPGPGSTAGLTCIWDSSTRKMTFTLNTNMANGATITVTIPVKVN